MKTAKAQIKPLTEGIKYAGSKLRLIPQILRLTEKTGAKRVFDGFSGTTRVSQALARAGKTVVANDQAVFSQTFGLCYLVNDRPRRHFSEVIGHLNALEGKDGWFTEHYGGRPSGKGSKGEDGLKKPFQVHNTRKLDAIREEIDVLSLDEAQKSVLLASLILALDKVDNTIGHFASYLREWSARSYNSLELRVPELVQTGRNHKVLCGDIFDVLEGVESDVAYFDPPYGSNNQLMPPSRVRYRAYYHLWTSVVLNDRPELFGKAKRRVDSTDGNASVFEDYRRNGEGNYFAVEALEKLIRGARAEYVILSYGSGGRATARALSEILERNGKVLEVVKVDHKRNVMASMRWTNEWVKADGEPNLEYLFLLRK